MTDPRITTRLHAIRGALELAQSEVSESIEEIVRAAIECIDDIDAERWGTDPAFCDVDKAAGRS